MDPDSRVAESDEEDNAVEGFVVVAEGGELAAVIDSDRSSYGSGDTARVSVSLANPGVAFAGVARTVVEDAAGTLVALLDERPVALEYGQSADWALTWPTGATWAGSYRFRIAAVADGEDVERASAAHPFTLEPSLLLRLHVRAEPALVPAGAPVSFALDVDNVSPNAVLEGAILRLRVLPAAVPGPALFDAVRALPTLLPGAAWEAAEVWPAALPMGLHSVSLQVEASGGEILASVSATLNVTAAAPLLQGVLVVEPGEVMAGDVAEARVSLTNHGTLAVVDYPISVDVVSGPLATVHGSTQAAVDVPVGGQVDLSLTLETAGLAPGTYVVLLRGGAPATSLSRDGLELHGSLAPPSPHAPADGGTVDSPQPTLVVNNASSAGSATRTYEFELFGDAALTQLLPGASGVLEEADRTSWRVAASLAEDTTYWWRARASDGFSSSPWSIVASFTVDALNRPPQAPVPDTPGPDARVASRQPALTVRNAVDPEGAALLYEFRLASSPEMDDVVTSITGVAEGLGLTSWTVPVVLEENAVYCWTSRASDGVNLSPWTTAVRFRVDTVNESPTPPSPLRPVDGVDVVTLSPTLVVENSTDPEQDPVSYRFEIDVQPTFDSTDLQASADVPEGSDETGWTPPIFLVENTSYYWRAFAGDGSTETSSAVAGFFVNVTNDPPSAPVPLRSRGRKGGGHSHSHAPPPKCRRSRGRPPELRASSSATPAAPWWSSRRWFPPASTRRPGPCRYPWPRTVTSTGRPVRATAIGSGRGARPRRSASTPSRSRPPHRCPSCRRTAPSSRSPGRRRSSRMPRAPTVSRWSTPSSCPWSRRAARCWSRAPRISPRVWRRRPGRRRAILPTASTSGAPERPIPRRTGPGRRRLASR